MSDDLRAVPLADLCESVDYGVTTSASVEGNGPQLLRITDIVPPAIDWQRVPRCDIDDSKASRFALRKDDIVVARTGATVGYAKRVRDLPGPVVFASYLVRFRVDASHDVRYVGHVVESAQFKEWVAREAGGAAQPNASASTLGRYPVPLPPLPEQRRIGRLLSAFDELIAINERRSELLEGLARSLYREWFVRFRFPGHPAAHGATAGVPDGWSTVGLGDVSENLDRYRRPLSKPERAARRGTFPYYGAAKLIDFINGWLFDGEYLLFAEDGTVQTPSGFPVLQLVEGQFWANNHTHVLRGTAVSTRYLYLAVGRYPIVGHVTGAAQPKVTQSNLRRVPVTRAPDPVHASFDRVIDPLFEKICACREVVSALARTRDLLLPRLVTGRLDISDVDLGDLLPAEIAA